MQAVLRSLDVSFPGGVVGFFSWYQEVARQSVVARRAALTCQRAGIKEMTHRSSACHMLSAVQCCSAGRMRYAHHGESVLMGIRLRNYEGVSPVTCLIVACCASHVAVQGDMLISFGFC